ncbi:MAG: prepilin-type N-terminal cleavage/methylation domain-containing protein [Nitrospina sp.]|nr:MAG: prepilin-type N-terminal cleavage/methylation domain-containing protein [Nitrospina sp.]
MKIWNRLKTQMQSHSGFTLIEVLIAITILIVGILGLLSTTGSVSLNQRSADNMTEATMIASDSMEAIKRVAQNEPSGGIFGFSYFVDDTNGFLTGYSTPTDFTRTLTETVGNFSRTTTITVFPSSAWATEDFTVPQSINMVEALVDVSYTNPNGITKNIVLGTVLQRRAFNS